MVLEIGPRFVDYDGDPYLYAWDANGNRRDLGQDQRYLIWLLAMEHSDEWRAKQQAIRDEANRKRSEATKTREREDDGTLASAPTTSGETGGEPRDRTAERERETATAKAAASGTNRGAVERMDRLARERPDLAEKVRAGDEMGRLGRLGRKVL